MHNPALKFTSTVLLGSIIAYSISGRTGVFLGFVLGLLGTFFLEKTSEYEKSLKTDVERVLQGLMKPEDWMHVYIKALMVTLFSPLVGIYLFSTLPENSPMPEVISVNVAFLAFVAGGHYIKNNFL